MAAHELTLKRAVRPCPICGAGEVEILHHQRFVLPENHILPPAFDVVACPECGFAFADTPATQAQYDTYYADFSKYEDDRTSTGGGGNSFDLARLKETARDIANILPRREARILDLGCANGGLLLELRSLGFDNVFGIDPSAKCVDFTKRQHGIDGWTGSLSSMPKEAGGFDVVIVSHVLEHVFDLTGGVRILRSLLGPGGLIYAEVPDAGRYKDFLVSPFQDFNIEHINHFDAVSLNRLFERAGFSTMNCGAKILRAAGFEYPALFGFYQSHGGSRREVQGKSGPSLRESLATYVMKSAGMLDDVDARLAQLANSNEAIIVWGTGQLTLKLLADTSLSRANIAAFVDGSPANQGKFLKGIEVLAPERLRALPPYTIVICSLLHGAEIVRQIRDDLRLLNPVTSLNGTC